MEDKFTRALFTELESKYSFNSYEEFDSLLKSDDKFRKALFDDTKDILDLGDYITFEEKLGLKKKDVSEISPDISEPSSEVQQPLPSAEKPKVPIKKEETLTERLDISSLLQAGGKRPDFLTQQRDEIVSTFEKDIKETTDALAETYQKKIEANPEQYDKLNKEYQQKHKELVQSRADALPKQIESLLTDEGYDYLEKGDIGNIQKQVADIMSKPLNHEAKVAELNKIKNVFLSSIEATVPEYTDAVKREINDVIAKSSLIDKEGNPTVFGWKQEVAVKKDNIQKAITELEAKKPDIREASSLVSVSMALRYDKDIQKYLTLVKANKMLNNILKLPDDSGNFWQGLKSQGDAMKSAGLSDLFETLDVAKVASKQNKGQKLSVDEQALLDAKGMYEAAISSEGLSKWFQWGRGIGGSVAWMEQFALTSGLGKVGASTITKLVGQSVKNKVLQNVLKGVGSAVARTPVLTGGYVEAIERATGSPVLTDKGVWEVAPESIEPIWKAIGKGAYSNFTEAFSEEAGGFLRGTGVAKNISKALGINKLPKFVKQFASATAFQPFGELPEEYLAMLLQTPVMGDQTLKEAFTWENIWDTAVQVGLMTGALGSAALPSIVANNRKRAQNKALLDIFGRDNVSALRDAIMSKDDAKFADAIKNAFAGKSYTDLQGLELDKAQKLLVEYAHGLAQERGATVAQQEITKEAQTQDQIEEKPTEPITEEKVEVVPEVVEEPVQKEIEIEQAPQEILEIKKEEEISDAERIEAKETLDTYLNTWANDVLKNKIKLADEIETDFDMTLTKLKNMNLIETDCI